MELPLEVIQQCMPESYAWLIEYDPGCFSNVSFNGKNYGLPRVNGDGYFNYAPFWRADWLAKFGYTDGKVPMTLEECEEVFYKFANEDPDGRRREGHLTL
jgi:ABC-type glycerol-3-phosphate transport system substrate-binding protein